MLTAHLAADGFVGEVERELGTAKRETFGRLVLAEGHSSPVAWAANSWLEPHHIAITSIGDAVKKLKAIQRNWALYPYAHHGRAKLIAEQLPKVSAKPLLFPAAAPTAPLGSWSLLQPDLMLASARCSSPFPNGEAQFVEDKTGPPNRAYLKLWEALTLAGVKPGPGDRCLDLGASPGGWTWVLANLGAEVIAVDKALLDPKVAAMPGVSHRAESAFGLDPRALGPIDWLFSDVICYPERLLRLVERWIAAGTVRRFICTIKFQGDTDVAAQAAFAAIPGSRLLHLTHNKHELTWIKLA